MCYSPEYFMFYPFVPIFYKVCDINMFTLRMDIVKALKIISNDIEFSLYLATSH